MCEKRDKILYDREERINKVKSVHKLNNDLVLTIKANIPGNNKNIKNSNIIMKYFLAQVLNNFDINSSEKIESHDGDYYIIELFSKDYINIKKELIKLEESYFGRFVDLDLYNGGEKTISRTDIGYDSRKCIICNKDIYICNRLKSHTVDEVLAKIDDGIKETIVEWIYNLTIESLIEEVEAHPKFGLVTKYSNGSHTDMNINTFYNSIKAIGPYIKQYIYEGFNLNNDSLSKLREIGKNCEKAMFDATGGINTHKGSIFLLGFLLPSISNVIYNDMELCDIQCNIKELSNTILSDFDNLKQHTTHGERLYQKYNLTGVRGVIHSGMNDLFENIDDILEMDSNVQMILLKFMSLLDDTTILHNNDINILEDIKLLSKNCLANYNEEDVELLTSKLIDMNISPGGSADMVICSLLLTKIINEYMI